MSITAILALAAAAQSVPAVTPVSAPPPARAEVRAVARARIISAAQIRIGTLPSRNQTNVRNGIVNFE